MAKVVVLERGDTKKMIKQKLEAFSATSKKGFNAKKFTGKIKSFGDGLAYQRKIRDEWD